LDHSKFAEVDHDWRQGDKILFVPQGLEGIDGDGAALRLPNTNKSVNVCANAQQPVIHLSRIWSNLNSLRRFIMSSTATASETQVLANQKTILENQAVILKNQEAIKKNQETLNVIVKNQEKILAAVSH
jgi:hypothetical protein